MNFFNPFRAAKSDSEWFSVGLASSFPDIDSDNLFNLAEPRLCDNPSSTSDVIIKVPGCRVFHVPLGSPASQRTEVPLVLSDIMEGTTSDIGSSKPSSSPDSPNATNHPPEPEKQPEEEVMRDLKDQVLVFQYKGKFHAIDHKCPHQSYPLSHGIPFDIEDFGIALSAGITCPKHGWSFDLFSGRADRGNYRLKVWEVQLRDGTGSEGDKEVFVRRKQRMG
ncbi:hypothetical protein QBC46DRAFT_394623 [Diplogelasinospora grovesii]|uniref:Rieske domain-containing protein n=1 Tax=Diplogelasinospora grovesii TaxID=303347 RepID=A0AAN6N064_9PEZI|nr:hypothetical protein QBC46DRAFT_394623 [Diplogelasinospora grovesii]